MPQPSSKEWIVTHTGVHYSHSKPRPEDVCIEDIAHSLSLLCRFTGHVSQFYSVAEHCVRVSYLCSQKNQLWALLHDASEAYCADISRPLKYSPGMEVYRDYERRSMIAIARHFDLDPWVEPQEVKEADVRLLYTEKRDLLTPGTWALEKNVTGLEHATQPLPDIINPMTSEQAKNTFLMRFSELTGRNRYYRGGIVRTGYRGALRCIWGDDRFNS